MIIKKELKITGSTVRLVPFSLQHLENSKYLNWLNDKEVMKLARSDYNCDVNFEDAKEYVNKIWSSEIDLFFAVESLSSVENNWVFVGTLKLGHINWSSKKVDLGIIVGDKTQWGKGIATKACKLALKLAFDNLDLHKVVIGCKGNNLGMRKVAKKLGFEQEGVFKDHNFIEGKYVDHYYFGLLNNEFLERET